MSEAGPGNLQHTIACGNLREWIEEADAPGNEHAHWSNHVPPGQWLSPSLRNTCDFSRFSSEQVDVSWCEMRQNRTL